MQFHLLQILKVYVKLIKLNAAKLQNIGLSAQRTQITAQMGRVLNPWLSMLVKSLLSDLYVNLCVCKPNIIPRQTSGKSAIKHSKSTGPETILIWVPN